MPAPIPTDTVRPQSERKASPTARGPWPRSQSERTPKTTRNGVALNGRTPANPAVRIAAATRSSERRNRCARRGSRKTAGFHDWLGRELGREDSNLQLPKLRRRRAQRRPKQDKNLSDPSNVKTGACQTE